MRKLTITVAAGVTAAVLAGTAVGQRAYVYEDVVYPYAAPRVIVEPSAPYDRYYVSRPYYAYESYHVWDPVLMRYVPRYRYRVVDDSGRSYPVTSYEAERLYGYPAEFTGNSGYLVWNGNRMVIARSSGLTKDSNPDDYSTGIYNPKK
jgi:hypothetical protein